MPRRGGLNFQEGQEGHFLIGNYIVLTSLNHELRLLVIKLYLSEKSKTFPTLHKVNHTCKTLKSYRHGDTLVFNPIVTDATRGSDLYLKGSTFCLKKYIINPHTKDLSKCTYLYRLL